MVSHEFAPSILRKYDIRGIVDNDLTHKDAYFLGLAFIKYLRTENLGNKITVAKDARSSGNALKESIIQGIIDGNGTVIDCGTCPTPACYFASHHFDASGFIMVTGSHNPLQYNGFKFGIKGKAFSEEEILHIAKTAKNGLKKYNGGSVTKEDIVPHYINRITSDISLPNFKFGFNALNGSAGIILSELTKQIGGMVFECDMNPNLTTVLDPSNQDNINRTKEYLSKYELDIIFMFDGDADRIMAITKNKVLYGEDILLLCVREVLAKVRGKVIFDVKCSNNLVNEIIKYGGVPVMYKTGHSLIKKKMLEENAVLAGEYSGHIYFSNGYYGFDDGIYTAVRLLSYFAGKDLDKEIKSIPSAIRSSEIKIPSKTKFEDIAKMQNKMQSLKLAFNDIDGIRFSNTSTSWFLIRASNTEEVLIVRYEGQTQAEFDTVKKMIDSLL